jgi:predicted nucleic acid-binding Zn ribbon protein
VTGKVELRLKPADLLGFLFLQLGSAFVGGFQFRQCPVCGTWSLLTPGANRADRTTCSDYCRLKRYRQRRARAVALGHSGWTPEQIAKEVGSAISKVKTWLSDAKD